MGSISAFMYGTFYYSFVPSPLHESRFNLNYEPCETSVLKCSYLNATHDLSTNRRNQVLMTGQPYIISVILDMPESLTNRELGMFVTCLSVKSKKGVVLRHNCRTSMMQYRSPLLRNMETYVFSAGMYNKLKDTNQTPIMKI